MKPFKVVCIGIETKDSQKGKILSPILIKDEIYTVIELDKNKWFKSGIGYLLKEHQTCFFGSTLFRPVDETFGEAVTETIEEQIEYYEKVAL